MWWHDAMERWWCCGVVTEGTRTRVSCSCIVCIYLVEALVRQGLVSIHPLGYSTCCLSSFSIQTFALCLVHRPSNHSGGWQLSAVVAGTVCTYLVHQGPTFDLGAEWMNWFTGAQHRRMRGINSDISWPLRALGTVS
jgi:hypothetical protein